MLSELEMMALSYSIETVIRGYHVYGAVWSARQGEVLYCDRELANPEDEFAVAVNSRTDPGLPWATFQENFLDSHGILSDAEGILLSRLQEKERGPRFLRVDSRFLVLHSLVLLPEISYC